MIIAAQDGSGDFRTVAEAVAAARRYDTIFVKKGVYRERVEIFTPDITIIGEDKNKTAIEYGLYAKMQCGGEKLGTFRSYTLLANADGILCKSITVANTAGFGSDVGQAVAVYAEGDRICFEDCRILGHQDTLFTGPLPHKEIEKGGFKGPTEFAERKVGRQTYSRCYIEGEVDFIFGSAAAYFEDCELFSLDCGREINGYVTAASTYCGETEGYIFKNCRFTGNCPAETVYLGRPWRNYARTVLIDCELGAHIRHEGFHDWNKPEAHKTMFYALKDCYGEGYRPDGLAPFVKLL